MCRAVETGSPPFLPPAVKTVSLLLHSAPRCQNPLLAVEPGPLLLKRAPCCQNGSPLSNGSLVSNQILRVQTFLGRRRRRTLATWLLPSFPGGRLFLAPGLVKTQSNPSVPLLQLQPPAKPALSRRVFQIGGVFRTFLRALRLPGALGSSPASGWFLGLHVSS